MTSHRDTLPAELAVIAVITASPLLASMMDLKPRNFVLDMASLIIASLILAAAVLIAIRR